MPSIKEKLYQLCMESVMKRIDAIRTSIVLTQASASEETKSSAGDKYETARAMAQLEVEKLGGQLEEALKSKGMLEQIQNRAPRQTVQMGSLVLTTQGNFFISVSAGPFTIEGEVYYPVSAASPIAQVLLGKKAADSYSFRNKEAIIQEVF